MSEQTEPAATHLAEPPKAFIHLDVRTDDPALGTTLAASGLTEIAGQFHELSIGRDPDCLVHLPDRHVGRHRARIVLEAAPGCPRPDWWLIDLGGAEPLLVIRGETEYAQVEGGRWALAVGDVVATAGYEVVAVQLGQAALDDDPFAGAIEVEPPLEAPDPGDDPFGDPFADLGDAAGEPSVPPIGEILCDHLFATEDDIDRALGEQLETGERIGAILVRHRACSPGQLARCLAEQWGEEWVDLDDLIEHDAIAADTLAVVAPSIARERRIVPIGHDALGALILASHERLDEDQLASLACALDLDDGVAVRVATAEAVAAGTERFYPVERAIEPPPRLPPPPPPPPSSTTPWRPSKRTGGIAYLGFEEVLTELRIDEPELESLVAEGELRGFRDGVSMKFKEDDVRSLAQGRETMPTIILTDSDQAMGIAESSDELILEDSTSDTVINFGDIMTGQSKAAEEIVFDTTEEYQAISPRDKEPEPAIPTIEAPSVAEDMGLIETDADAALVEVGSSGAMEFDQFEMLDESLDDDEDDEVGGTIMFAVDVGGGSGRGSSVRFDDEPSVEEIEEREKEIFADESRAVGRDEAESTLRLNMSMAPPEPAPEPLLAAPVAPATPATPAPVEALKPKSAPRRERKSKKKMAPPGAPRGGKAGRGQKADAAPAGTRVVKSFERRSTVRWWSRMNPRRSFPMMVVFSVHEVERIVADRVKQVQSKKRLQIEEDDPIVTVVPQIPGCLVVPPRAHVDTTPALAEARFHVTPVAEGEIPEAVVELRYKGEVVDRIPIPTRSVAQTATKAAGFFAVASPVLSQVLETYGIEAGDRPEQTATFVARLVDAVGGTGNAGWALMAALAATTVVLYLRRRPKAAAPMTKFFDTTALAPAADAADEAVAKYHARLLVFGGGTRRIVPVNKRSVLIGSAPHADVRIRGNGIVPEHAVIEFGSDGGFRIVDRGGGGLTEVNGALLRSGASFALQGDVFLELGKGQRVGLWFYFERRDRSLDAADHRAMLVTMMESEQATRSREVRAAFADEATSFRAGVASLIIDGVIPLSKWRRLRERWVSMVDLPPLRAP